MNEESRVELQAALFVDMENNDKLDQKGRTSDHLHNV